MDGKLRPGLQAAAVVWAIFALFFVALAGTQPQRAEASANMTAWLSTPPNSFEPMGYTVNGTAAKFVVDTLGWSKTKLMGNVGIGNGGVEALNRSSNQAVNHTDDYIMAADMSMAPWDPGRITGTGPAPATDDKNLTASNVTGRSIDTSSSDNISAANETPKSSVFGQIGSGNTAAMRLNDPYHSILMGRPVDDLCYQAPLAISISMYARLVGLPMPDGGVANMGIRNLGYGY
jgi:hypothetical protein